MFPIPFTYLRARHELKTDVRHHLGLTVAGSYG
jgi:hypothetical protein